MDKITSYTDEIKKYISGKQYAGKNIQTTDGVNAYVTKTGAVKPYESASVMSNKNGCTTSLEQIGSAWGDLGIPVGSLMVKGQSCGNEASYVQAKPPETTFNWKYYVNANPDLNLTTEQQAKDHWTSKGIHQGLLPNSTILSDMTNTGTIGYVDVNTTLHTVPQEAYKYHGQYNSFNSANITGTAMQDCTVPPPSVKYGDQIFMKYGKQFASMNAKSILEFGTTQTKLFLRPPGEWGEILNGSPIMYGEIVCIAASSSNVQTTDCGWWGCKVAYVNPTTNIVTFGPGGETGGTYFVVVPPSGSSYTLGTEVKYGDPFSLSWTNTITETRLNNGESLTPGQSMISLNSKYVLVHQTDGNICIYNNPVSGSARWCAMTNNGAPGNFVMQTDGNLCYYDANGKYLWGSQSNGKGQAPYYFTLHNDGNAMIFDSSGVVTWSTNTSDGSSDSEKPVDVTKIGYVKSNFISFKSISNVNNTFTFESATSPPYVPACNLNELQIACDFDSSCSGFIYSEKDNTWQIIPYGSAPNMYKITDTPPSIYVKEASVDMQDASCLSGTPQFIDSSMYASYPKGDDFVMNGNQCNVVDQSEIQSKQQAYQQNNQLAAQQGETIVKNFPKLPLYTKQTGNIYNQLNTKTDEYKKVLKTIKTQKGVYVDTYKQQNDDLALLENSNKMHVLLWGLSSIIVISMVVMLKNKQ
jgi:hypothetical protein